MTGPLSSEHAALLCPSAAALLRQQLTRYRAFALAHDFPFDVAYDRDDRQG
ncbi:hypothetical protein OG689_04685 [Kitasatospora sp. NBC_00240]|uniref:hypothetical protein n=1 Tax=Kitasatospora sp. NBC_00240 TaxID=2903567 RepID=UPI002256B744|nr:hypothetical protein [Kitasatospora sp. NBC_00240]MCX5208597.1 hypothetical protein [Kitasatospora sp. NBC_00240]